jgi:hypothetical protein
MLLVNFGMLVAIFSQVSSARKAQEVTSLIALNQQIYPCPKIESIVEDMNNGKKLKIQNGGRFTDNEIENFLGYFELIGIIKAKGYLEADAIHDMFGYDIEDIFKNKELVTHINRDVVRNDWPYLKKMGKEIMEYESKQ